MANLIQVHGGQPQKQPRYTSIFQDRAFTGLYTQRAVLHDPSDIYTSRYYGGRPDALLDGRNVELTNKLTLQRRPGLVAFGSSAASYSTPPNRAFSFQLSNGAIQVLVDTGSSGNLAITSCNNTSGGTTVYNGTFPGGGSNGYSGLIFSVTGFPGANSASNNGNFICTASTTTTLTLKNNNGVAQTASAIAVTPGAVYVDNQNGTTTFLYGKNLGAGQTQFVGVAGVLYMGDGVDLKKYTPLNTNGTIWNWGITAPVNPPTVNIVQSGAAATTWQASTVYSTMGLTKDTNATPQIWQLISVNADGSNPNSQYGLSGGGEPNWGSATNEGNTISDGGVTWTNAGAVADFVPNGFYTDMGHFGLSNTSFTKPAFFADFAVSTVYGNFRNNGGLGQTSSAPNEPRFNGAYPGPSQGYPAFNTHFFAVGSFSTAARMKQMRWQASHAYTGWQSGGISATVTNGQPDFILTANLPAPSGTTVYMFIPTTGGTSSSGYAPFTSGAAIGAVVHDAQLQWMNMGQAAWQSNHQYIPWTTHGVAFGCVHDGTNFQVCTTVNNGTSGANQPGTALASAVSITASVSGQQTTYTLGSGSWTFTPAANDRVLISGFANSGNNSQLSVPFVVVSATSNTIVVTNPAGVNETHSATITWNPWGTGYGSTTPDGAIVWTCVGPSVTWASAQTWHLAVNGFQPPSQSQGYGGSLVNGNNGYVQAVISSGTSGGSQPSWATTATSPPTTTDNTITWQAISAISTQSLAITAGLAWAYSYKGRSLLDIYSPVAGGGGGATPPGGVNLGAPFGSETNVISTTSPVLQISGQNSGAVFVLSGQYCPDPQCDTIVIYRSADSANGSGAMFELTEIPNVPSLAGTGATWTFRDYLPSVANGSLPGLNVLLPAPINGVNNPPPTGFLPMVYNYQRIWGANGQQVNFSGGPDTAVGNANEAFLISDNLPFLAPVTRLVRTPQGIVTFLTDSIEMIGGGPQTASFFSVTMAPGVGLLSYNACDVFAGDIYFFAADNTFRVITPGLSLSQFGFPLGDQFSNNPAFGSLVTTWNPANVYVAVHQNGTDNCVFVADGSSGWFRVNPHQVPGAAQGPEPIWSPFATITGGCKMVQSIETSPGVKQLLVGGTGAPATIGSRSLTTFTDNGTAYDAYFTMGSITLAHPGQIAILKFLEFDFSGVNYQPTVSYLLNEVSGSFTSFVNGTDVPVFDPPQIYGDTTSPSSYSPNRYYFGSTGTIARCRHMQVKVDFGSTSNGDEMYSMTIFGRLVVE